MYYSCPPLPVQILQFRVRNFVFSCLPKAISNRRYSHILFLPTPASCRFSNFMCKTLCFHAFPKPFQIEDIHIYYSCPPLPVQILQFRVQNLVFSCLPKAISNRRYSQILFLPTPAIADSPISCAKLGVFMPSQPLPLQILPCQIEDIHIYYSCPPLPVQILQFCVQNLVFSCLAKAISNRRYSHTLFLPTPASADSPISCAKLCVFMPSYSRFK